MAWIRDAEGEPGGNPRIHAGGRTYSPPGEALPFSSSFGLLAPVSSAKAQNQNRDATLSIDESPLPWT